MKYAMLIHVKNSDGTLQGDCDWVCFLQLFTSNVEFQYCSIHPAKKTVTDKVGLSVRSGHGSLIINRDRRYLEIAPFQPPGTLIITKWASAATAGTTTISKIDQTLPEV